MKSSFQILCDRNETLLSELQTRESEIRTQLKLNRQATEKLEQQLDAFSKSISPGQPLNLDSMRAFMGSIAQQQAVLSESRLKLNQVLESLLNEQKLVQVTQAKYTAILSRHDSHLRRVEAKREQKSNDEYAGRAWRKSHDSSVRS